MWFIVVLVSLVALFILFLCIPVELVFRANTQGRPKFSLRLIWFFGLVKRDLRQFGKTHKEKTVVKFEEKPGRNWLQRIKVTWEIMQTKGLLKQFRRSIIRTIRSIQVRELAANLKVGLDNPADTGLLFAFIAPVNLVVNYFVPCHINIEPSFAGESFVTGNANAVVKLIPIHLAASLGGLAFSLPALRATKKLVLYRWKRKR